MIETIDHIEAAQENVLENPVLSIEQIEQARDAEYAVIDVPEWGGKLRLASATTDMVVAMAKHSDAGRPLEGLLELLVQSFVDGNGVRSVTDPVQVTRTANALRKKEAKVIERLIGALLKLNNIRINAPGLTHQV